MHPEHRRQIFGWGQSVTRFCLTVGGSPAERSSNLFVQWSRVRRVYRYGKHGAINISINHRTEVG